MKTTTHNPAHNTASGHTPGPWMPSAILNPLSDSAPPIGFRVEYSDDSIRSIVAECRDHTLCDEHGTIEGNARLIAAAPDLLAALEESLTWMETYQRQTGTAEHGPLGHSIAQARAALTRARVEEVRR